MNNWYVKSVLTGVVTGLLSMLHFPNYYFGIVVFVVVTIIMILSNPKRRFMKAFWVLLSAFIGLNKFSLLLAGKIFEVNFIFDSTALDWMVSIVLLLLAAILLFLDYFERTERKFNLFGFINISLTKFHDGNTHIASGANVTYITVVGDYVVSNDQKQNLNDFYEVKKLIEREEELHILIKSCDDEAKINSYKEELNN